MTLLTEGFLERGHDVSVITIYGQEHDFFRLPAGAQRLALGIDGNSPNVVHGFANNLRRLKVLRHAIKSTEPEIVISHIHRTNVMTILAAGRGAPVVVVEHNDPGMNPAGRIWDNLRRRTYPRARKVVSVSHGVDQQFSWLPQEQRAVIHNPIESTNSAPHSLTDQSDRRWITAMGRLTAQKGFDLLLSAFAQVATDHPEWGLMIIGEGELRGELEELTGRLGLSAQVTFRVGRSVVWSSELFVMASRFEGFPYAALEALASGLPVIYTDCPSGPREIIRHGVDGLLVPNGDLAELAAAMDRLMSDNDERERLAAAASNVLERFGRDRIIGEWENLFASIQPANS